MTLPKLTRYSSYDTEQYRQGYPVSNDTSINVPNSMISVLQQQVYYKYLFYRINLMILLLMITMSFI